MNDDVQEYEGGFAIGDDVAPTKFEVRSKYGVLHLVVTTHGAAGYATQCIDIAPEDAVELAGALEQGADAAVFYQEANRQRPGVRPVPDMWSEETVAEMLRESR